MASWAIGPPADGARDGEDQQVPAVYGDTACGAGKLLAMLETAGADIFTKVQPPTAPDGRYSKGRFAIDLYACHGHVLDAVTVTFRPATAGVAARDQRRTPGCARNTRCKWKLGRGHNLRPVNEANQPATCPPAPLEDQRSTGITNHDN
jgi:hypothetical protein